MGLVRLKGSVHDGTRLKDDMKWLKAGFVCTSRHLIITFTFPLLFDQATWINIAVNYTTSSNSANFLDVFGLNKYIFRNSSSSG